MAKKQAKSEQVKEEPGTEPDHSDDRDSKGRFKKGNKAGPKEIPNAKRDRARSRIFREAILDYLNDPRATIPAKDEAGNEIRLPVSKAVARATVLNAAKGNGAAIRALLQVAGGGDDEDTRAETVIIRVARGGYSDPERERDGEEQEDQGG